MCFCFILQISSKKKKGGGRIIQWRASAVYEYSNKRHNIGRVFFFFFLLSRLYIHLRLYIARFLATVIALVLPNLRILLRPPQTRKHFWVQEKIITVILKLHEAMTKIVIHSVSVLLIGGFIIKIVFFFARDPVL